MKVKLDELVRLFHERKIVEKIAEAKGDLAVYEKERKELSYKLEKFKAEAEKKMQEIKDNNEECGVIEDGYEVLPEDALQISVICMMTGIDDCDLLTNYGVIPVALRQIKGKMAGIAENIAHFIGTGEGDEIDLFSKYDVEELLKKFFS